MVIALLEFAKLYSRILEFSILIINGIFVKVAK